MHSELIQETNIDGNSANRTIVEILKQNGQQVMFGNSSVNATFAMLYRSLEGIQVEEISVAKISMLRRALAASETDIRLRRQNGLHTLHLPQGVEVVLQEEKTGISGILARPFKPDVSVTPMKAAGLAPQIIFQFINCLEIKIWGSHFIQKTLLKFSKEPLLTVTESL